MTNKAMKRKQMDQIVSLCKRRGFVFQSSEIYGGVQGFWDYGSLGVELKRNVRNAWWHDMVNAHDEFTRHENAPSNFRMAGIESSIIMHPQVWKCSGHYDLFHDFMVDCTATKKRYRHDQVRGRWVSVDGKQVSGKPDPDTEEPRHLDRVFVTTMAEDPKAGVVEATLKTFGLKSKHADQLRWDGDLTTLDTLDNAELASVVGPDVQVAGTLTEPREFNLMFKTTLGALGGENDAAFLRPETAQGIFVNFKNMVDTARVKVPFGVAQIGKSFRNEITPRNFTFRSREFEQMEIEFFCHPDTSHQWYTYWRDRRLNWYQSLGLSSENLVLRDHKPAELSHYSTGTADVEYAFPFLPEGEHGELEGIAHRGDFDLRSHMEGKLDEKTNPLELQLNEQGQPKWRGSGKDLTYFDDQTRERFTPHVIEPSAGADRATLAFICEAYNEDEAPDDNGNMQKRVFMKFHPRLAPIKAAILPLIKKEGMPEKALEIYREFRSAGINVAYDQQSAIGRRYRRQDEAGTPYCMTVDGETAQDGCVTIRDRDSLEQQRVPVKELVGWVQEQLRLELDQP